MEIEFRQFHHETKVCKLIDINFAAGLDLSYEVQICQSISTRSCSADLMLTLSTTRREKAKFLVMVNSYVFHAKAMGHGFSTVSSMSKATRRR